jgi:hypothetical protein
MTCQKQAPSGHYTVICINNGLLFHFTYETEVVPVEVELHIVK